MVKPYLFQESSLYIVFIIGAIIYVIKPFAFSRILESHTPDTYYFFRLFSELISIVIASIFTTSLPIININVLLSLLFILLAYYANYAGVNHKKDWTEFASLIEIAKSYFALDLEAD